MNRYEVEVTEVQHVSRIYTVEADNPDQALDKASIGDTVDERDTGRMDVAHREVFEATEVER